MLGPVRTARYVMILKRRDRSACHFFVWQTDKRLARAGLLFSESLTAAPSSDNMERVQVQLLKPNCNWELSCAYDKLHVHLARSTYEACGSWLNMYWGFFTLMLVHGVKGVYGMCGRLRLAGVSIYIYLKSIRVEIIFILIEICLICFECALIWRTFTSHSSISISI